MRFQCRNSPLANAAGFVDVDKEIILGILSCVVMRCRCQKILLRPSGDLPAQQVLQCLLPRRLLLAPDLEAAWNQDFETLRRVPSTFSGRTRPSPPRPQSSPTTPLGTCRAVQSRAECRERTGGGSVSPVGPGAGSAVRQRGHFHLRWLHSMSRASGGRLADSDCASRLS